MAKWEEGRKVVTLGSYELDEQEMTLCRDGEVIVLEPKIFAVLIYLCDNKNRYISMTELHDNVWKDRFVSDAAVRRTISKLRQLFNDDHKNPEYIQSLPKRGYKLICSVSDDCQSQKTSQSQISDENLVDPSTFTIPTTPTTPTIPATPTATPEPQLPPVEQNAAALNTISGGNFAQPMPAIESSTLTQRKKPLFSPLILLIVLLLVAMTLYRFVVNVSSSDGKGLISAQTINALPGDKVAIAQSPDGQYLAISAEVSGQSGFQVYIKHKNTHDFEPVTHNAHLPVTLAFAANSDALFYSDAKEGASSLNKIDLTDDEYTVQVLLKNYFIISDVFTTSSDPKVIYFSGQQSVDEPRFIYRYNLDTLQTVRMTSSTQQQYLDMKGAITPDGKMMAVQRYSEYENSTEIRVINLLNNDVIYRRQQNNIVYDLQWLDNDNLLILDKNQLLQIDYKKELSLKLLDKVHSLTALVVVDEKNLLTLQRDPPQRVFFEQSLPVETWQTQQVFNVEPNVYYMTYQANNESKLVLFNIDGVKTLARLNTQNNAITTYLETEYDLSVIASATSAPLELIKINRRVALLNTQTNALDYITLGDDFVGDATFSDDQQSILFSVKSYDQWEIHRYDINSKVITGRFKGFRYIRANGSDFILGTSEGELFLHHSTTGEQLPLNYQLSIEPNTHWDVKADFIYWSSHDLVQTVFHQLDISNIKATVKTQQTFDYNQVRPNFSIKADGSALIYAHRQPEHSTIISLVIK